MLVISSKHTAAAVSGLVVVVDDDCNCAGRKGTGTGILAAADSDSGGDGGLLGVTEKGANDMGVPVLKKDTSMGMPRKDEERWGWSRLMVGVVAVAVAAVNGCCWCVL